MNGLAKATAARQRQWDPDGRLSLSFRGNEMAGEVGEACNVIKKLERERLDIAGSRDTVEHLAEELADVIITAYATAYAAGIDLDAAVVAKFNDTSRQQGLPEYHPIDEFDEEEEEETITAAALCSGDGFICALPRPARHHHLIQALSTVDCGGAVYDMGFVTSSGRYVGRLEAARIAIASGQVNEEALDGRDWLGTEDLW